MFICLKLDIPLWFRIINLLNFRREHRVVFLVNNKMYTQRRLTQLYIYLPLASGFGLTAHLQAFVLYTKSTHNW